MTIDLYINFDTLNKEYTCSYIIDDIVTTSIEQDLFNCLWSILNDLRKHKNTNRLTYTKDTLKLIRIDDYTNTIEYDLNTLIEYIF